jgi:4-hydroxy-tetrahydrodipicolinate reductase
MAIRIAVAGASGRMGQGLIAGVLTQPETALVAALDRADSPLLGKDAGQSVGQTTGVVVTDDLSVLAGAEVLIDFTRPEASLQYLSACQTHGTRLVLGTTGFDAAGLAQIRALAALRPVVFAPNMSIGVNVTLKILEHAAQYLSEGFDIEVIEAHHRLKVDAPSGTALKMGEVVARAAGRDFARDAVFARQGHTGPRTDREIGFSVIRGGDIVGDHTVLFAGTGERIEITHRASSRTTYVEGALRAARFLMGQTAGLFDMQDVLGLRG